MKVLVYKAPYPFKVQQEGVDSVYYQEAVAVCRLILREHPDAEFHISGTTRHAKQYPHIVHYSQIKPEEYDVIALMDWSTNHEVFLYRENPPFERYKMVKAQQEGHTQIWQFIVDFRAIPRLHTLANHVSKKRFPDALNWDIFKNYRPDRIYVTCADAEAYVEFARNEGVIKTPKKISVAPILECPKVIACPEFFEYCSSTYNVQPLTSGGERAEYDLMFYSGPKMTSWRFSRLDWYVNKAYQEGQKVLIAGFRPTDAKMKTAHWQAAHLIDRVPQPLLASYIARSRQVLLLTDYEWSTCQTRILRVLECVRAGFPILADEAVNWGDFSTINFNRELISETEIFRSR